MTGKESRSELLRTMWQAGWTGKAISEAIGVSVARVYQLKADLGLPKRKPRRKSSRKAGARKAHGGKMARFAGVKPEGNGFRLRADHPAAVEGRTLFPTTVVDAAASPRLLVSGHNQRKIGKAVTKGRWKGLPIYCLTLEERATCPASCQVWHECYGNNMHLARRHRHGTELEHRLIDECLALAAEHPQGFVVRLHILGDFYSVEYVELWHELMKLLPGLHIFGFTAHPPASDIGRAILRWMQWSDEQTDARAWIRFSGTAAHGLGALVIDSTASSKHVICPAQTGATDCCGTCGLCWTMDRPIEFVRH
jgi:hypothetical protein